MKRISIVFVIIVLIILNVGCTNHNNSNDSIITDTTTNQIETSSQSLEAVIDTEREKISEIEINTNVITVDKYEKLDVDNITFEQHINADDTVNRPLFPTLFEDNNIYVLSEYYTLAEKENTQNAILSFNILTKECEELFSYDFNIGYYPDFTYKSHYFTLPCTYNEDGKLQINIIDYDKEKDISKNIYNETVTSPYYYVDYINEHEVVFLIFPTIGKRTYQRVLKYDFVTSEISVLYENEYIYSENESDVSENIWTIDTFNGSIFILNTQVSDGDRSWSVSEIDTSGNILEKTALTGLYDYCNINCSVNQFVVTPNEYLIQYYDSGNNSNFVVINRSDPSINIQFDKYVPCTLISPFWLEDRYLLYSTFPDYGDYDKYYFSSDISVYDSLENTFHFLKISTETEYQIDKIISNEEGDVILVVADDTGLYQYLLASDIISYIKGNN